MKHRKKVRAGCSLPDIAAAVRGSTGRIALCAVAAGLGVSLPASADSGVPCLVMSGHAQGEHAIDLSKLNRITFGPESMTVSRAGGDEKESRELLYSLYHHIEIKNAMPDIETGIVLSPATDGASLRYLADTRSLLIDSGDSGVFAVGIFDLDGRLAMTAEMTPGDPLQLTRLPEGIYVAVATDKRINLDIKLLLSAKP